MYLRMNAPRRTGEVRFGYAAAIRTAPLPSSPQRADCFELHSLETIAFDIGNSVVERNAFVDKTCGSLSADRRRCRSSLKMLSAKSVSSVLKSSRGSPRPPHTEHVGVRHNLVQLLHLEPLMHKIARQRDGTRIG